MSARARLKHAARRLARPILSPLDGRVDDINRRVGGVANSLDTHARAVDAYAQAVIETASFAGLELRRIYEGVEQLLAANGALAPNPGEARTVELPFALSVLGRLDPPARILALGDSEGSFALSAASLGYRVTTTGHGAPACEHPNITTVTWTAGEGTKLEPGAEPFAAGFLSGVSADHAMLERIAGLLADDGLLVLATRHDVEPALDGWKLLERHVFARSKALAWLPAERLGEGETGVVMIVATPVRPG